MSVTVHAIIYKYQNYHKRTVVTAATEQEAMKFINQIASEFNEKEFLPDSTEIKTRILKIVDEDEPKTIAE